MKTTNYLLMVVMAGMLAWTGCGKSKTPPPPTVAPVYDVTKLFAAFPKPSPEVMASLNKIRFATRYRQLDVALVELDKLAQAADLTEPQKKVVSEKAEQVKQTLEAAVPKPTQ